MFPELIVIDDPTPRPGPLNMAIDEVLLSIGTTCDSAILSLERTVGFLRLLRKICRGARNRGESRRSSPLDRRGHCAARRGPDLFDHDRSAGRHFRTAIERNLSASAFDLGNALREIGIVTVLTETKAAENF